MRSHNFISHKNVKTTVNLTPFHYQYLMYLTNTRFEGDLSLAINYLLKKYLVFLYRISISQTKRSLTATYQPKTKGYKIKTIRIQTTYWGKLYDLRKFLGYSISFIIRIMLDWEMQDQHIPVAGLFELPHLNPEDREEHARIQHGDNYAFRNSMHHENLEVYVEFSCPAA